VTDIVDQLILYCERPGRSEAGRKLLKDACDEIWFLRREIERLVLRRRIESDAVLSDEVGKLLAPNAIVPVDIKTAHGGIMGDANEFNKKVRLLWLGVGTTEGRLYDGIKGYHEALDKAGIKNVYYESPGTAHEWLTWRRCLNDFAPRLFQYGRPAPPPAFLRAYVFVPDVASRPGGVVGFDPWQPTCLSGCCYGKQCCSGKMQRLRPGSGRLRACDYR